jgi:hypothetical protein
MIFANEYLLSNTAKETVRIKVENIETPMRTSVRYIKLSNNWLFLFRWVIVKMQNTVYIMTWIELLSIWNTNLSSILLY